jgi:hypothetical protein
VELELTRAAEQLIADCLPPVVTEMNYALAPLDRSEFEQLRGLLNRVLEHLQQTALPPDPVAAPPAPAARKPSPRTRTRPARGARR